MTPRLQKIRIDWNDDRLMALPGVAKAIKENPSITPDDVFNTLVSNDPTKTGKFVGWLLKAWEGKDFQWEDIRNGNRSQIHQTMRDFETFKRMRGNDGDFLIDEKHRSIMVHSGPQALWQFMMAIPELKSKMENDGPDTESNRHRKKMVSAKAHMEAWHHVTESGLKVTVPLTLFASQFFGRNTKWCTTEADGYSFRSYTNDGPLMIFTFPDGTRFQGWGNTAGQEIFLNVADLNPNEKEYDMIGPYVEEINATMRSIHNEYMNEDDQSIFNDFEKFSSFGGQEDIMFADGDDERSQEETQSRRHERDRRIAACSREIKDALDAALAKALQDGRIPEYYGTEDNHIKLVFRENDRMKLFVSGSFSSLADMSNYEKMSKNWNSFREAIYEIFGELDEIYDKHQKFHDVSYYCNNTSNIIQLFNIEIESLDIIEDYNMIDEHIDDALSCFNEGMLDLGRSKSMNNRTRFIDRYVRHLAKNDPDFKKKVINAIADTKSNSFQTLRGVFPLLLEMKGFDFHDVPEDQIEDFSDSLYTMMNSRNGRQILRRCDLPVVMAMTNHLDDHYLKKYFYLGQWIGCVCGDGTWDIHGQALNDVVSGMSGDDRLSVFSVIAEYFPDDLDRIIERVPGLDCIRIIRNANDMDAQGIVNRLDIGMENIVSSNPEYAAFNDIMTRIIREDQEAEGGLDDSRTPLLKYDGSEMSSSVVRAFVSSVCPFMTKDIADEITTVCENASVESVTALVRKIRESNIRQVREGFVNLGASDDFMHAMDDRIDLYVNRIRDECRIPDNIAVMIHRMKRPEQEKSIQDMNVVVS